MEVCILRERLSRGLRPRNLLWSTGQGFGDATLHALERDALIRPVPIERWTLDVGRWTFASVTGRTTTEPDAFLGLPHRPPFVFVRHVIASDPGVSVECATRFEADDPMFAGHFPGNPLVPGVILTEALAQAAGIAAASGYPDNQRPLFLLSAIRGMKFHRAALPGDEIRLRAEKLVQVGELLQFTVKATVAGAIVAEGQLVLSIAPELTSRV